MNVTHQFRTAGNNVVNVGTFEFANTGGIPAGLAIMLAYLVALGLLAGLLFGLGNALIGEGQAASRGPDG